MHMLEEDNENDMNIKVIFHSLTIFVTRLYLYVRTRLMCTRARFLLLINWFNVYKSKNVDYPRIASLYVDYKIIYFLKISLLYLRNIYLFFKYFFTTFQKYLIFKYFLSNLFIRLWLFVYGCKQEFFEYFNFAN